MRCTRRCARTRRAASAFEQRRTESAPAPARPSGGTHTHTSPSPACTPPPRHAALLPPARQDVVPRPSLSRSCARVGGGVCGPFQRAHTGAVLLFAVLLFVRLTLRSLPCCARRRVHSAALGTRVAVHGGDASGRAGDRLQQSWRHPRGASRAERRGVARPRALMLGGMGVAPSSRCASSLSLALVYRSFGWARRASSWEGRLCAHSNALRSPVTDC
jgi:hypothetical protein